MFLDVLLTQVVDSYKLTLGYRYLLPEPCRERVAKVKFNVNKAHVEMFMLPVNRKTLSAEGQKTALQFCPAGSGHIGAGAQPSLTGRPYSHKQGQRSEVWQHMQWYTFAHNIAQA